MRLTIHKRRGLVLMLAVILMSMLSFLMVTIATQMLLNRRAVERRIQQVQAHWLARSGIEVARACLAERPNYSGDMLQPIPDSHILIRVRPSGNRRKVEVEAAYPNAGASVIVRGLEREF